MSDQFSEEQLRAELEKVRVEDLVIQSLVSLINLTGAKTADREQLHLGIEAARALLPLIEEKLGPDANTIRDAISQLQLLYAKGGGEPAGDAPAAAQPEPEQPAQRPSGLWVPGQ